VPGDREQIVVALSPAARLGALLGAVVLVGMLGVLIAVLVSLEGTRSEIRTTRMGVTQAEQRFERVTKQVQPLLDATKPLLSEVGGSDSELRKTGRGVARAAKEVPALARDARRGLEAATFLAQTVGDADLGRTLSSVRVLAEAATANGDLSRLISGADRLVAGLAVGGRQSLATCDARLRDRPASAPGQASCLLRVVPNLRSLLRSLRRLNRLSAMTQLTQLSVTRRTDERFAESILIQRQLLDRVRSIDRKTVGPPEGAPTGPAVPPVP